MSTDARGGGDEQRGLQAARAAVRSSSAAAPSATNRTAPVSSPSSAGTCASRITVDAIVKRPKLCALIVCVISRTSANESPVVSSAPLTFAAAPLAMLGASDPSSVTIRPRAVLIPTAYAPAGRAP